MKLDEFFNLDIEEIAALIHKKGRPNNIALMYDGTRRMLKLESQHHDDAWLYDSIHIRNLMYKCVETVDILFNAGVNTITAPLASIGNLNREKFMPSGLECLLGPLLEDYPLSIINKHNVAVTFYGDLEYARSLQGGEIIDEYAKLFSEISNEQADHHVVIGIGFSTERETELIAQRAVDFYIQNGRKPSYKELVVNYFGFDAPLIDIFIRTNEMKASGGLTPLLTGPNTQLYVPVSPGIVSMDEHNLKLILHDYLFNRSLSEGMHEHSPITPDDAVYIKKFYLSSLHKILGVGKRIGDLWIAESNNE